MPGIATLSPIKHPRYACVLSYNDPLRREKNGRAKRVVKYFTSMRAGETARTETNRTLAGAGTAGVHLDANMRGDYLAARAALDGAGYKDTPVFAAVRYFIDHAQRTAAECAPIGPLFTEFLRVKRVDENLSERWVNTLRIRVDRWIKDEKIETTADITPEKAEAPRRREGVKVRTRLADLTAVSTFLGFLTEQKWLAVNPLAELKRPKTDAMDIRTLKPAQVRALLEAARELEGGRLLRYFAIGVFAFLRPSEIEALPEERIITAGRNPIIRVVGGKRRQKVRVVPILAPLRAWLKIAPKHQPIANMHGGDIALFDLIREKAGLVKWSGNLRGKRKTEFSHWQTDIMRHTGISLRMGVTNDENVVAMESGNSPDVIHAHYLNLYTRAEIKALLAIVP